MLRVVDKVVALMGSLLPADIEALPPIQRQRLADRCRWLADMADKAATVQKAGVLGDLRSGNRQE